MQHVSLSVSVVICTRNRAASLVATFEALQAAAARVPHISLEVIVVDNGSTDDTSATLDAWADGAAIKVRTLFEPRLGLAIARNTGVNASNGDIIVFTDDDCRLQDNYFEKLLEIYDALPSPRIIGGRVLLGDARDLPVTIKEDAEAAEFDGIGAGGFLLGCNMTMTRSAWDLIGEMDERLGAGTRCRSAEDTDYIYRAYIAGVPVSYCPDLVLSHFHGRRSHAEVVRLFEGYNIGNGALYAKYFGTPFTRQFRWDFQNAVRELFGKSSFKPDLGLTYRSMVGSNLSGMLLYWRNRR